MLHSVKKLGENIRSNLQIIIDISNFNLITAFVLSIIDVRSSKNKLSSVNACHMAAESISRNEIGSNFSIKT